LYQNFVIASIAKIIRSCAILPLSKYKRGSLDPIF